MQIIPTTPTVPGHPEYFTGAVWIDGIISPQDPSQRMVVTRVRFAPGARTAWHTHVHGQTLHITQGTALFSSRDGSVLRVSAGETVYALPGEEHWHAAVPDSFMEHLAGMENGDDPAATTTWLEPVSEADYRAAAEGQPGVSNPR
ncbi:MAG: cupin domain-containing protein [Propioniciclava sp.]